MSDLSSHQPALARILCQPPFIMKFLAGLTLATLAAAAPGKAPTPLDVKLEVVGNSEVKATVTNVGKNNLKVLKTGSFLDNAAVEKARVTVDSKPLEFDGLRLRLAVDSLTNEAFQVIPAGESVEVTFDIAEVYDLAAGGKVNVVASGALSFAEANSNTLIGSVGYESNAVEAEVNGEEAAAVRVAWHQKRTAVQSDCTGTAGTAVRSAISSCATLARAAQTAASSGAAAKVTEYFKSATTSVRNTVSTVFSRVASECSSTTGGNSRLYCTDVYNACSSGVIAYTVPSLSIQGYCGIFFNSLPALSRTCHAQDRATTIIHEMTHLTQVKGTSDYSGYGYNYIRSLTAAQNLNHADTYTLFAQAIYAGC
ncbi:Neutral protease [Paramyrothecium foliicola]|nr:Neutral protease [Paramyrothecium foliicola]